MFTLVSDFFANADQDAYFGQLLRKVEPNLTWIFLEFDELAWQLLF